MSARVTKTSLFDVLTFLHFEGNGPGFNARSVHMGFMMDKVELGQVFFQVHWFLMALIILLLMLYSIDNDSFIKRQT